MKRFLFAAVLLACFPLAAQAHFLWLLSTEKDGTSQVQVFFGESAEPDDPDLLDKVLKAELFAMGGRGEPKVIALEKKDAALVGQAAAGSTLVLRHPYGVMSRGDATFLLKYYAKTYASALPGTWKAVADKDRLPLEIVPSIEKDGVHFLVTWQGKPLAGSTVTVNGPGITDKIEGTTGEDGKFAAQLPQAGTFSIRAKHTEAAAGKFEDKEYKEVRHYSTLTLQYTPVQMSPLAHQLPSLEKGTTSFGGAVVGNSLYVYGGNYGGAHEYKNEDQSGDLWALDLAAPGKWEVVSTGPRLQGLAMVEYKGMLIRVGGFTATNKAGEKEDLRSQADVAKFNPATKAWENLPALPSPRSSHDAAIVGDTLYVVGGWNMQGGSKGAQWHDTTLALDLSAEKPQWKQLAAPPFKRRALALAAWQNKLVSLGGMEENGTPTRAVTIFDPAKNEWSTGPAIHGGGMEGFGCSAFASQGVLYVTTMSGSIQRLSSDGTGWTYVGQLSEPRFFHRLLPWQENKLVVVGGASMETGKTDTVELFSTGDVKSAAK